MGEYTVAFSHRFDRHLAAIVADYVGFGPAQTRNYIEGLLALCAALESMPYRYSSVVVKGRTYRRIPYRAHCVYYRVFAAERRVFVDAVLHGHQDPPRHL
ncbi:MAG: hypothetical protein GKR94_23935 [Gammaproteobacteria bacterium]|nr:hypothetical protein [Gammaproteobacteria bacterium]